MISVLFNSVDEFIEEMIKDADKIERRIVRVTKSFESTSMSPKMCHVSVKCGYVVDGGLVELKRYCGLHWGLNNETDIKIMEKTEEIHKKIEKICNELKLEVRAGAFQAEAKPGKGG